MKHLGDITKISGSDAPVVDVIIGGSPCQDLSIAGKRAGLAGERSGLYMEQIRIIKEMREADALRGRTDELIRPRYMVWENVPGAFSSNGGKDFAAVLEEAIRVAEPEAPAVPVPEKGWPTSGCFFDVDGRWSVAWRVFDAQFWGVPQRRRRIALVADFGGLSAPEILFVRKSVSGHSEPGKQKGKEAAGTAGESAGGAVGCDLYNGAVSGDKAVTLTANAGASATHAGPTVMEPVAYNGSNITSPINKTNPQPGDPCHMLFQPTAYGISSYHSNAMLSDNPNSGVYEADTARTLDSQNCGYPGCNQGGMIIVHAVDARNGTEGDVNGTLQAKSNGGVSLNCNNVIRVGTE